MDMRMKEKLEEGTGYPSHNLCQQLESTVTKTCRLDSSPWCADDVRLYTVLYHEYS